MNRLQTREQYLLRYVPRTRGDEPPLPAACPFEQTFPAHAGMNQSYYGVTPVIGHVPRTRGDEPLSCEQL